MQHIVITGADGGLGRPVVSKFLEEKYQVHAIVSPKGDEEFTESDNLKVYRADLMKEEEAGNTIRKITDNAGEIAGAVLIVGGFGMGTLQETGLEEMEKMYRLNFVTAYNCARPLLIHMEKAKNGGQIVLIGARPGIEPGAAKGMVAYALSKSLLFRLSEIINETGRKSGIVSSVIVPSIIDTPANRESMPDADYSHWVTGEQIAENILHLFSPAGRHLREPVLKVYGQS